MINCQERILSSLCIVFCIILLVSGAVYAGDNKIEKKDIEQGKIDPYIAEIAYAGEELLSYDVSWTGGIKIGELRLQINPVTGCDECFEITSVITTSGGIIHALYPIEDRHVTLVKGAARLPYFCEIWQKQGRNYQAHKIITFDQNKYILEKQKTGEKKTIFQLDGVVHNEFSSFFSSRVMNLQVGKPIIVPTFGDDTRNEVVVVTYKEEIVNDTLLGSVNTLKVSPILTFSGLYDKKGDTVIWYTADECRVPVLIQSKIVFGSLTASLSEFSNPYCSRYSNISTQIAQSW